MMNLMEIRNLAFKFMKQFNANELKLLMNFLELSVSDYERDPTVFYENLKRFEADESLKYLLNANICLHELNSPNKLSTDLLIECNDEIETQRKRKDSLNSETTPDRSTDNDLSNGYQSFNEQDSNDTDIDLNEQEEKIKSEYSFPQLDQLQHSMPKYHTEYLNTKYSENPYPTSEDKKQYARETNLTELQINQWFNAKRTRLKQTKPRHVPRFSAQTIQYLNNEFNKTKYPSLEDRHRIALATNISLKQVQTWFINQRNKK